MFKANSLGLFLFSRENDLAHCDIFEYDIGLFSLDLVHQYLMKLGRLLDGNTMTVAKIRAQFLKSKDDNEKFLLFFLVVTIRVVIIPKLPKVCLFSQFKTKNMQQNHRKQQN